MKRAIVCGAAGFIGSHMVQRLKDEGYYVRGFDIKMPEFRPFAGDDFHILDLRYMRNYDPLFTIRDDGGPADEVYQLACNMGGMGFLGDPANDAAVLRDNSLINLNVLEVCRNTGNKPRVFFSSSACVYPRPRVVDLQKEGFPLDRKEWEMRRAGCAVDVDCAEHSAYPAHPDLEYGYEKLFSERLYAAYGRNGWIEPRIARFHNIFGPFGTWKGGREKAPAAICRKVSEAKNGEKIYIWGDGEQTRSFLYVDEAIEGVRRLINSDFEGPVNIGSSELVSINALVDMVCDIAGKALIKNHVEGHVGVRGRNSDNTLIGEKLKWKPTRMLRYGLEHTYRWVDQQAKQELTRAA